MSVYANEQLGKVFKELLIAEANIKTIRQKLLTNEKLLKNRLDKCLPHSTQSQHFDEKNGSTVAITDLEQLDEIAHLTTTIGILRTDLEIAEQAYAIQKGIVARLRMELNTMNEKDLRVIIFEERFVNKKTNEQIASEYGYSIQTVWNNATMVNAMIYGEAN